MVAASERAHFAAYRALPSLHYLHWNDENGDDYFIKRDLPDIWALLTKRLAQIAPIIWDKRIIDYLDQVNIYTADEIFESVYGEDLH